MRGTTCPHMRSHRRWVTNGACTHKDGRPGGQGRTLLLIRTETVMAGTQDPPSGPDLTQGVAFDQIADGTMLAGQVDGEAVLMARRGDEIFAVGATCTHYNGPLPEGILVGETVRCPWHHACFSLRTGVAVRAPALTPLPR